MELKEVVERIKKKQDQEGFKDAFKDFHSNYGIDQRELGKIIVIVSLTLLVVSIPASMMLQKTHSQIRDVNENFDRTEVILNDDSFRGAMESLSNVKGSNVGQNAEKVLKSFDQASESLEEMEKTQEEVGKQAEDFKWLSLIGIVGFIGGLATMYV